MDETRERTRLRVSESLRSELGSVRGAILFVASGRSSRVTLSGLAFGESLLGPARRLAARHDVRVEPLWSADEVGASLSFVRREADA